jgi:hypothetical protein
MVGVELREKDSLSKGRGGFGSGLLGRSLGPAQMPEPEAGAWERICFLEGEETERGDGAGRVWLEMGHAKYSSTAIPSDQPQATRFQAWFQSRIVGPKYQAQ